MQATEEGEFYPEKPLDGNYKIPRKGAGEMSGGNQAAAPAGKDPRTLQAAPSVGTPLAASYYNYPYDPNQASAYYQYYNNYSAGAQQVAAYNISVYGAQKFNNAVAVNNINACASSTAQSLTGMNFSAPPPPPPPNGTTTVEVLKRNIFETYNSIREKPKTYTGGKTIHNNESETAVAKQGFNNKTEALGDKDFQRPPPKVDNFSNSPNAKPDFNNKQVFQRPPPKAENFASAPNARPDFNNKQAFRGPPPNIDNFGNAPNAKPDLSNKQAFQGPPPKVNNFGNAPNARPDFSNEQAFQGPPPKVNNFGNAPNAKPGFNDKQGVGNKSEALGQKADNFGNNPNAKPGFGNRPFNRQKFDNTEGVNQGRNNPVKGGFPERFPNQQQGFNVRGGFQANFRNQNSNQPRFNSRGDKPNLMGGFNNRGANQDQNFGNREFNNDRGANQQWFGNQRGNQQRFNNPRGSQQGTFNNRRFDNNQQGFENRKNYQQDQRFNDSNNSWDGGNNRQWGNRDRNRFQGDHNDYDRNCDQNFGHDNSYRGNSDNWAGQNDRGFRGRGRGFGNTRRFNNGPNRDEGAADYPNNPPRFGKRRFNDDDKWGYDAYDSCTEKGYEQYSRRGSDDKGLQASGKYKGLGFANERKRKKEPPVEIPVEQTVPDLLDNTLPKDLKTLFQPLFCKLCEAQLSSNQTAKMHYKSKNHEKKIRKWLVEYAEKTGEPLHPRATTTAQEKKKDNKEEAEKNPTWFHCDVCDLDLTGKMHAESHYMGRNHQKALLGHRNPAGNGYYDADGKWIRIKNQKSKSYDFEKGEDNFGLAFKPVVDAKTDEPPSKKMKKDPAETKEFHCQICNINTTCQEQLDTHFMGQKHLKKLKLLGLENYTDQRKLIEESGPTADVPTTPSAAALELNIDVASYRTPSGDYYCPTCNLSLNSEVQFLQHMKSKGHAKKLAQKKKDDAAPPAVAIASPIVITGDDVTGSLTAISEEPVVE